jgi:hypothetical protein
MSSRRPAGVGEEGALPLEAELQPRPQELGAGDGEGEGEGDEPGIRPPPAPQRDGHEPDCERREHLNAPEPRDEDEDGGQYGRLARVKPVGKLGVHAGDRVAGDHVLAEDPEASEAEREQKEGGRQRGRGADAGRKAFERSHSATLAHRDERETRPRPVRAVSCAIHADRERHCSMSGPAGPLPGRRRGPRPRSRRPVPAGAPPARPTNPSTATSVRQPRGAHPAPALVRQAFRVPR